MVLQEGETAGIGCERRLQPRRMFSWDLPGSLDLCAKSILLELREFPAKGNLLQAGQSGLAVRSLLTGKELPSGGKGTSSSRLSVP